LYYVSYLPHDRENWEKISGQAANIVWVLLKSADPKLNKESQQLASFCAKKRINLRSCDQRGYTLTSWRIHHHFITNMNKNISASQLMQAEFDPVGVRE